MKSSLTLTADLNKTDTPPAIIKINGLDAVTMISDLNLKFSGYQDPDSQWNSVFRTTATPGAALTVAASLAFQGESVTLAYDNGEEKTEQSFAILRPGAKFDGVTNGEDFYQRFLNPDTAQTTTSTTSSATSTTTSSSTTTTSVKLSPTILGYPYPVIRDSGSGSTAGYFLNGTGYDNVAVLALSSFSSGADVGTLEYLTNYQDTISKFLAQSKAAGKNRLVIDLTGNGGGFVIAGYELFAQVCSYNAFGFA
jgi:hypothetical protein